MNIKEIIIAGQWGQKAFAAVFALLMVFAFGSGATGYAKALPHTMSAAPCSAEQGQLFIEAGQYAKAIQEFSCVIQAQPTEVEGYRGRIEAEVLLGRYSDGVRDYARITALVMPVHPDAQAVILAGYNERLAVTPNSLTALTGASFARWWFFDYASAIHLLNQLLGLQPNNRYGNLLRGSARLLLGATKKQGVTDLDRAIQLDPQNPHVRFIVADAFTYGLPDLQRAFTEATTALNWGLNTPRLHAILANAYQAFGDEAAAAIQTKIHIQMVTTELLPATPLTAGNSLSLNLVPGRSYEIPVPVVAGETLSLATTSPDFYDTIMVLLAPDGTPIIGRDDVKRYFAKLEWTANATGNYRLLVTSFESVNTGELVVSRN